jgi:hypothetical protein
LLEVSRIITGNLRLTMGPVELSMVISAALDAVHPEPKPKPSTSSTRMKSSWLVSVMPTLAAVIWNLFQCY